MLHSMSKTLHRCDIHRHPASISLQRGASLKQVAESAANRCAD